MSETDKLRAVLATIEAATVEMAQLRAENERLRSAAKALRAALEHEISCEWCAVDGCHACAFGCTSEAALTWTGDSPTDPAIPAVKP